MIVRTQSELDAALSAGEAWIEIDGDGEFVVRASGSATVRASGSATVRAYGSATVTAYGSATVRAYGSATVRAYGSATVRASGSATVTASGSATVTAYGSATVRASGSATVTAGALVPVHDHGPATKITGGAVVIPIRTPETMADWCAYYGVDVSRGWAVVYKAVDDELVSGYRCAYPIGEEVACPDWDAAVRCGNGLHFSPRAFMSLAYAPDATRFLAVKVKVSECVVLGDKIKAPRCKVLHEVDEDGEPLTHEVDG